MPHQSRPTTFVAVTMILLGLSAGVNVLQAQRIRALMEPSRSAVIGRQAPVLSGFSLAGLRADMSLRRDLPTVVYFFSATCTWCERNWDNIAALGAASGGRYRVLAVSSERDLKAYVDTRRLRFDVLEGISENTRRDFGFSGTPHTLVVSTEGLITHEWRGAYTPRVERQIEELFGVLLPGVAPPGPTASPSARR